TSTSTTTRSTTPSQSTQRRQRDIFDEIETLASDYDDRVREARESKGLTQEELAKNLKEKVSLIKKIENGHMQPNEDLREKLERELQVSLTEEVGEEEWESDTTSGGYTLGDIVKRKEK
ncbi:MAG: multiprotein bridging factor aMBF1, partial [Halobacteria archaeon]|nr:multiprotein bridging factor aMBF1 [Halobacteria archaeon]